MRIFYTKYQCPRCGIKYGQTELQTELEQEHCNTCKWGLKN